LLVGLGVGCLELDIAGILCSAYCRKMPNFLANVAFFPGSWTSLLFSMLLVAFPTSVPACLVLAGTPLVVRLLHRSTLVLRSVRLSPMSPYFFSLSFNLPFFSTLIFDLLGLFWFLNSLLEFDPFVSSVASWHEVIRVFHHYTLQSKSPAF